MADTGIQTSPSPPADTGPTKSSEERSVPDVRRRQKGIVFRAVEALASLRLTVVLFALSLVLIFAGTLAQVDHGIWTVVGQYFRSLAVWIPFQIFFPRTLKIPGGFPFPGGWLLGGLLLLNLLAAHAIRFKVSWKRSGILLIHAGLIVMMLSELIVGLFQVEAKMTIPEGQSVNYTDVNRAPGPWNSGTAVELAFVDPSDPKVDRGVVIPGSMLRRKGIIRDERLPVEVEVLEFMENSNLALQPDPTKEGVEATNGKRYTVTQQAGETGVDGESREDAPAVRVLLRDKETGKELGTYLLSLWYYPNYTLRQLRFAPQTVVAAGKKWDVELRFRREYKPYSLYLIKFTHDKYTGTDTPKDYASDVRLLDKEASEDRQVRIYMNNPLFYGGETFYQSSFLPGDRGTVLQVVRNFGWRMPYISCVMVTVGMLIHFLINLVGFLNRKVLS